MDHSNENGKSEMEDEIELSGTQSHSSDGISSRIEHGVFSKLVEDQRPHSAPSSSSSEVLRGNEVKKVTVSCVSYLFFRLQFLHQSKETLYIVNGT